MNEKHDLEKIGEGTYGKVYRISGTNKIIKRMRIDKEFGIHFTAIRELKIYKTVIHPNILRYIDFHICDYYLDLILEYMPFDLSGLLQKGYCFSDKQINSITYQLLDVFSYIHEMGFIYRDLKPGNILLNRDGVLKITDFGLARQINYEMTNKVCSLWYRAPELLLGSDKYTFKSDSWSLGCVLLELKYRKPVFRGENEIDQIKIISEFIGMPDIKYIWSDLFELKKPHEDVFWNNYSKYTTYLTEIICKELMRVNENHRISVKNAFKMANSHEFKNFYEIDSHDVHNIEFESKNINNKNL